MAFDPRLRGIDEARYPSGREDDIDIVTNNSSRGKANNVIFVPHPVGATPTDITSFV